MTDAGDSEYRQNNRDVLGIALIGLGCVIAGHSVSAVTTPEQAQWYAFGILLVFTAGLMSLMTSEPMVEALDRAGQGVKNVWN